MKLKKVALFRPALLAVGVFLGHGAYADTTLTFDGDPALCTPPQQNNPNAPPGITNFGNYAASSSVSVDVTGFGTPNIGLGWGGIPSPDTRWEYYNKGGLWLGAVQLQGTFVDTTEVLNFIPNNPSASAVIESFKFWGYYNDNERFTYDISVTSGTNVLYGPTKYSFLSDGTKNHLVSINYTGAPGQTLKLRLARVPSTLGAGEVEGGGYNNAADDIKFAQTPATAFPAGPQVVSVTPADDTSGWPATSIPPYAAIITNGPTLTVATPVSLKLDYTPVSPPPTVTSLGGGLTSVTHTNTASVLLANGLHVYTLTYADNLGGFYTNEVVFSTSYKTLPPAYALPPGSGITRGFTFRTVLAPLDITNSLDNTIARAVAQLNGTLTNRDTGMPYTNSATLGTNADGSFSIDGVLNFNGDNQPAEGDFGNDQLFPGLPFFSLSWFSTEALLFLDLPAGYYRLGVNSDDGFEVNALAPPGVAGPPIVLGLYDAARGAADTLFDVLVPSPGVYPFQVIYFQGTGSSTEEFFSVTNFATAGKVLINDPASEAIKSYRDLRPHLTRLVHSGSNAVIDWAYGTPPFQLQFKSSLTNTTWSNVGASTTNRTATVPLSSSTGFYRVYGQ